MLFYQNGARIKRKRGWMGQESGVRRCWMLSVSSTMLRLQLSMNSNSQSPQSKWALLINSMRNLITSKTLSHSSCKSRKTRVRCTTQRTRSYRPQPHTRCSAQQTSMHRSTYSRLRTRANWRRKRSPTSQAKETLIYHSRCLPPMSVQLVLACRPWKTKWR